MSPHADASRRHDAREVGGAFLMERLTETLVARGAILSRLQARIFGGGNLIGTDIGRQNIEFAINFLRNRRIPLLSSDVGGRNGRWLRVWPAQGHVEVRQIEQTSSQSVASRANSRGIRCELRRRRLAEPPIRKSRKSVNLVNARIAVNS